MVAAFAVAASAPLTADRAFADLQSAGL